MAFKNFDRVPQTVPIERVAERLGVSAWTVRTWIRAGRLSSYKVGRRVLISEEEISDLLSAGYRPASWRARTKGPARIGKVKS